MATANFPPVQTSKYYTFGHNNADRESWDSWDWQIYYNEMDAIISDRFDQCRQYYPAANDRASFGRWIDSIEFAGLTVEISINLYIRSGHYEGGVFDIATLSVEGYEFEPCEDIEAADVADILADLYDMPAGWYKIQASNFAAKLDGLRRRMISDIEAVMADLCEERLAVCARFSNGETWYARA